MALHELLAEVAAEARRHCAAKGYTGGPNWNPLTPWDGVAALAMARFLLGSGLFDHYLAVAPEGHVYGFFFEQLGAVFMAMVRLWPSNPLLSVVFGLYVFLVHGSAVGLAMTPIVHRFEGPAKSSHWARVPLVVALMVGFAFAGCWLVGGISLAFGGLPPKRSIVEYPFW